MIDGEGALGDKDGAKRTTAVENHFKWVEAAKYLGCHSIRVNAQTNAEFEEGKKLAADGLRRLSEYAKPMGINVIVENHGGLSSNGKWHRDDSNDRNVELRYAARLWQLLRIRSIPRRYGFDAPSQSCQRLRAIILMPKVTKPRSTSEK